MRQMLRQRSHLAQVAACAATEPRLSRHRYFAAGAPRRGRRDRTQSVPDRARLASFGPKIICREGEARYSAQCSFLRVQEPEQFSSAHRRMSDRLFQLLGYPLISTINSYKNLQFSKYACFYRYSIQSVAVGIRGSHTGNLPFDDRSAIAGHPH